jgi:hypothetical protein
MTQFTTMRIECTMLDHDPAQADHDARTMWHYGPFGLMNTMSRCDSTMVSPKGSHKANGATNDELARATINEARAPNHARRSVYQ